MELPVGMYGEVYTLMRPNSLAKNKNCLLVNSLALSLKIYLLPQKVKYMPVKYALMTFSVLFNLIGAMNI